MWNCQLCQNEFEDTEPKTEVLLEDLQQAFYGIAIFETEEPVVYLCGDCFSVYQNLKENENFVVNEYSNDI